MTRGKRTLALGALCLSALAFLFPTQAEAQRRAVRRPPTRAVVVTRPRVHRPIFFRSAFFHPWFYRPAFYYSGFYSPYYWGWYPPYSYPPYGWSRPYDTAGSARIQVTPREAQVYVDGYFVGVVDDFDGVFQRLHVPAGEHELTFYMEGYRTIRQKVLFRPGATLKLALAMQPLGPGEQNEPKPAPDPNARPRPQPYPTRPYERPQGAFGALSLRVQPADAVVMIDGEPWDRPESEDRFFIELPEGPHRLEVRKDGFRTYIRTIDIRRGQTVTLNISLTTGGAVPVMARR